MKMDTVAQKLTIPLSLSLSIVYKISRLINFDDTHFHRYFNRLLIAHASGEIVSMRHDRQTRRQNDLQRHGDRKSLVRNWQIRNDKGILSIAAGIYQLTIELFNLYIRVPFLKVRRDSAARQ